MQHVFVEANVRGIVVRASQLRLGRALMRMLLTALLVAGTGQAASATIFLTGDYIQLPIDDVFQQGRFMDTGELSGALFNPAGTGGAGGTDFWVFGSPVYNYTIAAGGSVFRTNGFGWIVGPSVIDTSSGLTKRAHIVGTPISGLDFIREVSFHVAAQVVTVTDTLTNSGASVINNLATLDNTDPDQDVPFFGGFATENDVVSVLASNDLVLATGPLSRLTVGFGSPSPLRIVDASGFSNTNPYTIRNFPVDPNGAANDIGINLVIDHGTLTPGQSSTVTWYLVFGASKAEAIANYQGSVAVCGNGEVETGEECDDGNTVSGDGCDANCKLTACGNGIVTSGEQCDDGNTTGGDGCDGTCLIEPGWICPSPGRPCEPVCGDGLLRGSEQCDDGNLVDGDGCDGNCTLTGCGNGITTAGEECDDGNLDDSDACKSDCTLNVCGDGFLHIGVEQCDDGNDIDEDFCKSDCTFNLCGDGIVLPGWEECDDGNLISGDGCDANCTLTRCGNGIRTPDEECDDGNPFDWDFCKNDCTFNVCGDGVLSFYLEECDDGNDSNDDACKNDCTFNYCGDGHVHAGVEQCDDGNFVNSDACKNNCTFNVCGDGVVHIGVEQCDDGNANDADACKSDCTLAACGDGVVRTSAAGYVLETIPFAYIDISSVGTPVPLGDDQLSPPIPLGFDFDFFGNLRSFVHISSNGFLAFDPFAGSGCCSGWPIPHPAPPNDLIAGFWTDLYPVDPSNHRYARVGDIFVVEVNTPLYTDPSLVARFQYHLHANSNVIKIHYLNAPPGFQIVTGGIENAHGTEGAQHYHDGDGVLVNTAVRYRPQSVEQCDDGNLDDGDGCDSNCTPTGCGNGVRTEGEECDDGNPDDGDGCDSTCATESGWTCPDTGPCEPVCGDGLLRGAEQCDDGNLVSGDGCDANCTFTGCGNGIVTAGEECDDGNLISEDACKSDCTQNVCGDGVVWLGVEQCDDGNLNPEDGCKNDCTPNFCGDGVLWIGVEECDDGNFVSADGCDPNCRLTGCGNGIVTAGEQCDDGNLVSGDGCDANCTFTSCGNGIVTAGEQCDDGNLVSGDGCDANCRPTGCGNGIVSGNEECDDGNLSNNDACTNLCRLNVCGDGNVRTGVEQCDDGNLVAGDGCSAICTTETGWTCPALGGMCTPVCGDGLIRGNEECDDGNLVSGDGCDANCKTTGCGNGVVTPPEECDDGNSNDHDACKNDCTANVCGDGTLYAGFEQCDDGNTVAGDGCSASCRRETDFLCYRGGITAGAPKPGRHRGVAIADRFGAGSYDLKRFMSICSAADRNGRDPEALGIPHGLTQYGIRSSVRFFALRNRRVLNQLGTLEVDLLRPSRLLVPAAHDPGGQPPEVGSGPMHHVCYDARVSRGLPRFTPVRNANVVEDRFGALAVDLIKPTMLCVPASVEREDPAALANPDVLMCYRALLPSTAPRFRPVRAVRITDRVGPLIIDALKPSEICLPSRLVP